MADSPYPKITIEKNAFSADIDHTTMTGGTFNIRKIVKIDADKSQVFPILVLFPDPKTTEEVNIHSALHTLEHGLAYTGGVRDELVKLSQNTLDRNSLIDISPYISSTGQIGFRMLSLFDLDHRLFETAVKNALLAFSTLLTQGVDVPFANERQCGQFRFHSSQKAIDLVNSWASQIEFVYPSPTPFSPTISVADLRLLKPQLRNLSTQLFLTPKNSYYLSQQIEKLFVQSWQSLDYGKSPKVFIGTYGCMTGMYITSEYYDSIDNKLHTAIARILLSLLKTATGSLQQELQQVTNLISTYSPKIFEEANQKLLSPPIL